MKLCIQRDKVKSFRVVLKSVSKNSNQLQRINHNSKQVRVTGAARGEMRASKTRLVLVLFLIG